MFIILVYLFCFIYIMYVILRAPVFTLHHMYHIIASILFILHWLYYQFLIELLFFIAGVLLKLWIT